MLICDSLTALSRNKRPLAMGNPCKYSWYIFLFCHRMYQWIHRINAASSRLYTNIYAVCLGRRRFLSYVCPRRYIMICGRPAGQYIRLWAALEHIHIYKFISFSTTWFIKILSLLLLSIGIISNVFDTACRMALIAREGWRWKRLNATERRSRIKA